MNEREATTFSQTPESDLTAAPPGQARPAQASWPACWCAARLTTDRAPRTPRARLVLVLVVVPSGTIFFLPSFPVATFRPCKVGPARAARPPLPDTRSSQQTNLIIVWILVCEYIHQTGLHDSARRNSNDRQNQNWCRFELLHAVHFVLDTLQFF